MLKHAMIYATAMLVVTMMLTGCGEWFPNLPRFEQEPPREPMTFYVDYDGGADHFAGTTPETPFKHAPSDPAATALAKRVELIPGDKVLFKGSVHYRGSLVINTSGLKDKPIVFDGNTAGTFGQGQAILDGGELLTKWNLCASPDECGGNANWANIWRADAPAGVSALTSNLHQGDRLMILAQHPNPAQFEFTDDIEEYLRTPAGLAPRTSITDERFAQLGSTGLVGGYVYVWRRTNQIDTRRINAYDGIAQAIRFDELGGKAYPEVRYALANMLCGQVFDTPGEYVFLPAGGGRKTSRVYLWPLDDADPNRARISVAVRPLAIELTGENHYVTVQGFRIENYQRAILRADGLPQARGITIRDNEITRIKAGDYANAVELYNTVELLVDRNYLHDCAKMRGVVAHRGVSATIASNRFVRMGRTPIVMYEMSLGRILSNTILHCQGMHSNGISCYINNRDILIAGNYVYDSNIPLTCSGSENVTIRNNVFDGAGRAQPISFWEGMRGEIVLENNILIGSGRGAGLCIGGLGDRAGTSFDMFLTLRNNIMDGPALNIMQGTPWTRKTGRAGNIYLAIPEGFALAEDERITDDIRKVLPNVGEQNYARAEGVVAGPE